MLKSPSCLAREMFAVRGGDERAARRLRLRFIPRSSFVIKKEKREEKEKEGDSLGAS